MPKTIEPERGFSLIEVLIAIFILFIFIAAFSVLFSNSIAYIFSAGSKTDAQYDIQEAAESKFFGAGSELGAVKKVSSTREDFEIVFSGYDGRVLLDGEQVEMEAAYRNSRNETSNILVTFFIPRGVTQ